MFNPRIDVRVPPTQGFCGEFEGGEIKSIDVRERRLFVDGRQISKAVASDAVSRLYAGCVARAAGGVPLEVSPVTAGVYAAIEACSEPE